MTPAGRLIEVQATGEGTTFTEDQMVRLVRLAHQGCKRLDEAQAEARRKRRRRGGRRGGAGGLP